MYQIRQNFIKVRREKNQKDATTRCLLLTSVSTCFGHHYAHLQENKGPVTAFGVYWSFGSGNEKLAKYLGDASRMW